MVLIISKYQINLFRNILTYDIVCFKKTVDGKNFCILILLGMSSTFLLLKFQIGKKLEN